MAYSAESHPVTGVRDLLDAAERGEVEAQFELAERLRHRGTHEIDFQQAFSWYLRAAESSHTRAQHRVGICLLEGIGCARDPEMAIHWLQAAAEDNFSDAQALIGWCYQTGTGTPRDFERAFS